MSELIEKKGHLCRWPGGAYGFIATDDKPGKLYFAHIKQFDREARRRQEEVKEGAPVEFKYDPQEVSAKGQLPRAYEIKLRGQQCAAGT